jgi:S-DNA-T family DNA segregation ATPase FtsK/SpoIIIE
MKNFFLKQIHAKRLKNAFNFAGLFYTTKHKGNTIKRFPKILDVKLKEDKDVYVFRLPHSIDPKEIGKKEYVFRSIFGNLIEFKIGNPISLTVYKTVHYGEYDYNFEQLKPIMSKYKLPTIAGKDINGKFYCYDMTKTPHLLMAGETGSGKSFTITAILTSWIQYFEKGGIKLYLADLKRGNFHLFRNVNLVEKVVVKVKEVLPILEYFMKQIDVRGALVDQYGVDHIDSLPKNIRSNLDYLILCIDEFSLLREEKDAIDNLIDISALGRALGIYVVLSTQRPDAKIIDGRIKANLTVRYGFRVQDRVNSNIILGSGKVDCSKIDSDDKGKFYFKYNGFHYLQAPKLPPEQAKEILQGYKSITRKQNNINEFGNSQLVLEGEFRIIEDEPESDVIIPLFEDDEE